MYKPSEARRGCLMPTGGLFIVLTMIPPAALARDDGRYANSPLKGWFDSLNSGKGLCCSMSDGITLDDDDVETRGGHYRVRWGHHDWVDVPDSALITVPCTGAPSCGPKSSQSPGPELASVASYRVAAHDDRRRCSHHCHIRV
jgi:hypothetical protein